MPQGVGYGAFGGQGPLQSFQNPAGTPRIAQLPQPGPLLSNQIPQSITGAGGLAPLPTGTPAKRFDLTALLGGLAGAAGQQQQRQPQAQFLPLPRPGGNATVLPSVGGLRNPTVNARLSPMVRRILQLG